MIKHNILLFSLLLITVLSCGENNGHLKRNLTELPEFAQEKHRPLIHFSPEEAWMNDPNGMVYYEGEYHLFFQYYPDSTVWGPMHWGHAVSTDLVHWEELPIALYPDELGYIFSGSAVIDWNNTTGLQEGEHPPMIAVFTHHEPNGEKEEGNNTFQYQSIAYSLDKGRSWTKYEGNPVVPNPGIRDFRDPKVSWNEATKEWFMIFAAADRIRIYTSPNLIDWQYESEFGAELGGHSGVWECPDLFELKVEGSDESKWVMLVSINPGGPNGGSATQYFVGDFDGKTFTTEQTETLWLDHGRDNYAGVTWSDVPKEDGRRLFMGWMSNWDYAQVVPTENWRSAMTLPRSLHLKKFDRQFIVQSKPVKELEALETEKIVDFENYRSDVNDMFVMTRGSDDNGSNIYLTPPYKIEIQFNLEDTEGIMHGIELQNHEEETYNLVFQEGVVLSDRSFTGDHSFSEKFSSTSRGVIPDYSSKEKLKVEFYVDQSSIEVFINDGELVLTEILFPKVPFHEALVKGINGKIKWDYFKATELKTIW